MFHQVKGHNIPVVVGAMGSYKMYSVGLELDPSKPRNELMGKIREKWINALDNPVEPKIVDTGPCKENILVGDQIDIHKLPVPVWAPEKDGGSEKGYGFLTSPYHVTKDPDTGTRNVGTYRNMIRDEPNIMGIAPMHGSHCAIHVKKNEEKGKDTEIATVLGADPTIGMVSVAPIPYGVDEFAVAGGLRGAAVELVKCETVDLEVPATAEIVIEGKLLNKGRRGWEREGPFGEYTGYEGPDRLGPLFQITCITHRHNPIYQGFVSQMPPSESTKVKHMANESIVLRTLRSLGVEGVVDLSMPEAGGQGVIIVSIQKQHYGHPRHIAEAVFSVLQPRWGKFVIVTDDDIDIYDLNGVLWAVMFRTAMTPNRKNIQFLEGICAQVLDYSGTPSIEDARKKEDWPGVGVFIDATRPYSPYPVTSLPPARYLEKAREEWEKYGLPTLETLDLPRCVTIEEEYLRKGVSAKPGRQATVQSNVT